MNVGGWLIKVKYDLLYRKLLGLGKNLAVKEVGGLSREYCHAVKITKHFIVFLIYNSETQLFLAFNSLILILAMM